MPTLSVTIKYKKDSEDKEQKFDITLSDYKDDVKEYATDITDECKEKLEGTATEWIADKKVSEFVVIEFAVLSETDKTLKCTVTVKSAGDDFTSITLKFPSELGFDKDLAVTATNGSGSGSLSGTKAVSAKKWYQNPWLWGGIVVGVLFLVAIIAGIILFVNRKKVKEVGTKLLNRKSGESTQLEDGTDE